MWLVGCMNEERAVAVVVGLGGVVHAGLRYYRD